jgi:hypothetical protein
MIRAHTQTFCALCLLLFLIQPVQAQEGLTTRAVLSFPQHVWFEARMRGNLGDIASARLTISAPNSETSIQDFGAEAVNYFQGESAVIFATWNVPRDAPPPLLSEIRYMWQVTRSDGVMLSSEGSIAYADTRVAWQQASETTATDANARFELVTPSRFGFNAGALRARLQPVHDLMQANTGQAFGATLLLHPESVAFGCPRDENGDPVISIREGTDSRSVACDLALAERVYLLSPYEVVLAPLGASAQTVVLDGLFAVFHEPLWASVPYDVPAWLRFGLRQFYEPLARSGALAASQRALRTARPLTLAQMDSLPAADDPQRQTWEDQAYGMVLYIADTDGLGTLFTLARNLSNSPTFAEAYQTTTGRNLQVLIPNWQSWLFSAQASSAYRYNPYLPTTATATFTPSITPSATITPTSTATVPVTRTSVPSNTPRPATATITPRPAQSFVLRVTATPTFTPSPTPIPETTEEAPTLSISNEQLLVLAAGGLLLLVIVVLGVVLSSRRR